MNYPDGTPIQVGDLVWWNEGVSVGFIQWIWDETRDGDYSWAKTDGPPLYISNRHPYAPSQEGFNSGSLHDEPCLADEGVGLLSVVELDEFQHASSLARIRSRSGLSEGFYTVETRVENCKQVEWIFSVYDVVPADEGWTCLERIIVRCDELLPSSRPDDE